MNRCICICVCICIYIYNSERTVCLASKVATNCWRNNRAQCSCWVHVYAHAHRGNLCPLRRQLRVLGGYEGMVYSNLRHCISHFPSCLLTTRVGLYGYYCPVYWYWFTFIGTILNVCSLFISKFTFSQPTLSLQGLLLNNLECKQKAAKTINLIHNKIIN